MSGKLTLISSATASGSANVSFTSGIDSTYDEYVFYFVDVNPATDNVHFQFQVNADGATGFNETITSTAFGAEHYESGATGSLNYEASYDQAQGTAYQYIGRKGGNASDEGYAGCLHLFSPSSTTKVKHFYSQVNSNQSDQALNSSYIAGYINTTSAIDEIDFKMSSGNFDGNIYLFGVS